MINCAYCLQPCIPTREHVIPDWFARAVGTDGLETFNARSSLDHLRGDILVKDVCSACNGVELSQLDEYGRELFEKYFRDPVYLGESVEFTYDYDRLVRWLLKLCFNSARVHNSDVGVLEKYRGYILGGGEPAAEPLVYVHIVAPTDTSTIPPSAARRILGCRDIEVPCWFRLSQFRPRNSGLTEVVQRQVYINSFCFTVLALDPDFGDHVSELASIREAFEAMQPDARPLTRTSGLRLSPLETHAVQCILGHFMQNPIRYGTPGADGTEVVDAAFAGLVRGEFGGVVVSASREDVEAGRLEVVTDALEALTSTRQIALAAAQLISVVVDGYNDDPRELWEIPEARAFIRRVFDVSPFVFLLARPGAGTIKLFAACYCDVRREASGRISFDSKQMQEFVYAGFHGLNSVAQRLALSSELVRKVSGDVLIEFGGSGSDDATGD